MRYNHRAMRKAEKRRHELRLNRARVARWRARKAIGGCVLTVGLGPAATMIVRRAQAKGLAASAVVENALLFTALSPSPPTS